MGQIGLAIFDINGGYLMTPFWSTLSARPLMAKLGLVIILIALIVTISLAMKKAKKCDMQNQKKTIQTLGKISSLITLTIVIQAVMVFHQFTNFNFCLNPKTK